MTGEELERINAKVDACAEKVFAAVTEGKRQAAKEQLCERCIQLLLRAGNAENLAKRYAEKPWRNGRRIDGLVLVETLEYALRQYTAERGRFSNFFLFIFKRRDVGQEIDERKSEQNGGMKVPLSSRERKLRASFHKVLRHARAKEALQLENDTLETMSAGEIQKAGRCLGMDEKSIVRLQAIAQKLQLRMERLFFESEEGELSENRHVAALAGQTSSIERDFEQRAMLEELFTEALLRASKTQKAYFRCFLTQMIFREFCGGNLSEEFARVVDRDLLQKARERGLPVITDDFIAGFLGRKPPAVSKQREKFFSLLRALYEGKYVK